MAAGVPRLVWRTAKSSIAPRADENPVDDVFGRGGGALWFLEQVLR